jgi:hypothetical protein
VQKEVRDNSQISLHTHRLSTVRSASDSLDPALACDASKPTMRAMHLPMQKHAWAPLSHAGTPQTSKRKLFAQGMDSVYIE